MNIISIIKKIVLKPKEFFISVKKQGLKEPFLYHIIFSSIINFFVVYFYLKSDFELPSIYQEFPFNLKPEFNVENFIYIYAGIMTFHIFFTFIRPAVAYMFLKFFSKSASYKNTYKSVIYGNTPGYLATPFYIIWTGLGFGVLLTGLSIIWILFLICFVIWLSADIYGIYVKLVGISQLQKVSKKVAFLCLFVFPIIFLILLEMIVLFFVGVSFYIINLN